MRANNVNQIVDEILLEEEAVSSGSLARRGHMSRQAAHTHLRKLVSEGTLRRTGAGRSAAYQRSPIYAEKLPRMGLREDDVWMQVAATPAIKQLKENVSSILRYALTEIVNNAHDHSRSDSVTIEIAERRGRIRFRVADSGIGIFENVRQNKRLKHELEALAELQKGKVTTDPMRHTGEGIFFTSKMGDYMTIESHSTRWLLDNTREDQAVEEVPTREGTDVLFEISSNSDRVRDRVFEVYTTGDKKFSKSKTVIHLFVPAGGEFISRSEGKRVTAGLENFQEVELDFKDVRAIGQGFADEVFRVWQNEHPKTKLVPVNVNESVQFMLDRSMKGVAEETERPVLVQPQEAVTGAEAGTVRVWPAGEPKTTSSTSGANGTGTPKM